MSGALLTVADVAARLRVSERAVSRLIATGQLSGLIVARKRRIRPEAVEAFLRAQETAHTTRRRSPRTTPELRLPGADHFLR